MTTVTLAAVKSRFWELLGEQYSGVATGGSTTTLVDSGLAVLAAASESWPTPLERRQLRVTSGAASGDLKLVGSVDRTTGTIRPTPPTFTGAGPSAADTYELWGNAIHGGATLTALANRVLRRLRPIVQTKVTIVTNQERYTLTTLVPTRRDILNVYLRELDPNNVVPWTRRNLWWDAEEEGSTPAVTLVIRPLVADASQRELWVEHAGTLTAFTADTSTVDANYQTWIAWEMVYELARERQALGTTDAARWHALEGLALERDHLPAERARWEPVHPIKITDSLWRRSA